nr:hypothetical protein [Tanacetum cinerariifolium]
MYCVEEHDYHSFCALTWWDSHKRTIRADAAFALSWKELMKLMAERFQELTMIFTKMVPEEEDQVEKFIGGLLDNIQGNVFAAEPRRLQDARDNRRQQPPFKRPNVGGQNVARAIMAGNNKRKPYNGPLPLCNKCKLHHEGPCTRAVTCFECGRQGYYRSDGPKLKDQNRRNKARNKNGIGEARGKAYVLGGGDANPDSNFIKGTFLLNNHYAFVLFDSGADQCFVSTTFSTLLNITLDTLYVSYAVKLVDERVFKLIPYFENHHAMIVCDEKIVQIPYGDEVLIVQGDRGGKGEKLKLSIISCTRTQKVQFLGHVIDSEGLAGYYRRFIEGFSKIAKPMIKLTQKNLQFDWSEKTEAAFQLLKQKLCSALI